MAINLGDIAPDNFMLGDLQVDRIMQGDVEVWSAFSICGLTPIANWKLQGDMTDACGSNDGSGSPSYVVDNGIQVWDGVAIQDNENVYFDVNAVNSGVSLAGWVKVDDSVGSEQFMLAFMDGNSTLLALIVNGDYIECKTASSSEIIGTTDSFNAVWKFVILTSTEDIQTANVNGSEIIGYSNTTRSNYTDARVGSMSYNDRKFGGRVSNAMFFNKVLTEEEKVDLWESVQNDFPLT